MMSLLICSGVFAQKKRLVELASYYYETYEYSYTEADLPDIITWSDLDGEMSKEEHTYNELNQCVQIDAHQLMSNGEWLFANYVTYTYNEHGDLATRTNYNYSFDTGVPEISGLIVYNYDDNHRLIEQTVDLYMSPTNLVPLNIVTYTYDAQDRLQKIFYQTNENWWGGDPSWKNESYIEYRYNENGALVADSSTVYDYYSGAPGPGTKRAYFYDEHGNLIREDYFIPGSSAYWSMQQYTEFDYNTDLLATYYVFPKNPELPSSQFMGIVHERTEKRLFGRNESTYEWELTDTYEYIYEDADFPLAVASLTPEDKAENVAVDAVVSVVFNQNIAAGDLSKITISEMENISPAISGAKLTIEHPNFECKKTYTVVVPAGAITGFEQEIRWSFTTADTPGALTVVALTPEDKAQDVAQNAVVSVTFNQDITAGDLSKISISEMEDISPKISGAELIIDHPNFEYEKTYTVIIPAGAVAGYEEEIRWSFTTEKGSGIADANKLRLLVYPNPATESLTVEAAAVINEVIVYDMTGKIAHRNSVVQGTSYRLNANTLPAGVYLLSVKAESGYSVTKFVVR